MRECSAGPTDRYGVACRNRGASGNCQVCVRGSTGCNGEARGGDGGDRSCGRDDGGQAYCAAKTVPVIVHVELVGLAVSAVQLQCYAVACGYYDRRVWTRGLRCVPTGGGVGG